MINACRTSPTRARRLLFVHATTAESFTTSRLERGRDTNKLLGKSAKGQVLFELSLWLRGEVGSTSSMGWDCATQEHASGEFTGRNRRWQRVQTRPGRLSGVEIMDGGAGEGLVWLGVGRQPVNCTKLRANYAGNYIDATRLLLGYGVNRSRQGQLLAIATLDSSI